MEDPSDDFRQDVKRKVLLQRNIFLTVFNSDDKLIKFPDGGASAARMQAKARRVISAQVLITAAVVLLLHFWQGPTVALSAGIGGAIGFVPAWFYAWKMDSGGDARDLLRAQYKAEFYKFAVTALMFALTFILFREVAALYLFLTYFATLAVYWVALVMG